ncbi:MAG: ribose-phosphate pyrophosphokinase [Thermodesulfobacteriota bacterium]
MGEASIVAGSASTALAGSIAMRLGVQPVQRTIERFPDGEMSIELGESVRGRDLYLVQSTSPPAEASLLELLLLADACRRSGAARSTAVIPYFGYARQDRRARGREAVGARVAADLVQTGGFARVVCVDLHTAALEGFFAVPVEHLTAVPLLADAIRGVFADDGVVVAPDLGAAKLADRYAARLGLPVALVHKVRASGERVSVRQVTGDVRDRRPIFVDDMITTGGTIEAAARALLAAGCRPEMAVVATHGVLVGPAAARLDALPIRRIVVTDTVAAPATLPRNLQTVAVADLLAEAIAGLHRGGSLLKLAAHH